MAVSRSERTKRKTKEEEEEEEDRRSIHTWEVQAVDILPRHLLRRLLLLLPRPLPVFFRIPMVIST